MVGALFVLVTTIGLVSYLGLHRPSPSPSPRGRGGRFGGASATTGGIAPTSGPESTVGNVGVTSEDVNPLSELRSGGGVGVEELGDAVVGLQTRNEVVEFPVSPDRFEEAVEQVLEKCEISEGFLGIDCRHTPCKMVFENDWSVASWKSEIKRCDQWKHLFPGELFGSSVVYECDDGYMRMLMIFWPEVEGRMSTPNFDAEWAELKEEWGCEGNGPVPQDRDPGSDPDPMPVVGDGL